MEIYNNDCVGCGPVCPSGWCDTKKKELTSDSTTGDFDFELVRRCSLIFEVTEILMVDNAATKIFILPLVVFVYICFS